MPGAPGSRRALCGVNLGSNALRPCKLPSLPLLLQLVSLLQVPHICRIKQMWDGRS